MPFTGGATTSPIGSLQTRAFDQGELAALNWAIRILERLTPEQRRELGHRPR